MKQLYFIAIVLPEPLRSEIAAIKHDLAHRHKTFAALKSPAHITLAPPFTWKEPEEYQLVNLLKKFQSPVAPFEVTLEGFGAFMPRVIFIQPRPDESLQRLYEAVQQQVVPHLPDRKKTSPPFHPHITVANRDWDAYDFQQAWAAYKDQSFTGKFTVNEIVLLKLVKHRWEELYRAGWGNGVV